MLEHNACPACNHEAKQRTDDSITRFKEIYNFLTDTIRLALRDEWLRYECCDSHLAAAAMAAIRSRHPQITLISLSDRVDLHAESVQYSCPRIRRGV